jgi:sec-independent protein translocase protein TatB
VLDNLGSWELIALILAALFIIGPERLPKVLSDAMGLLRKVRSMARGATSDLSRELGTNIELEDLHPKTFIRKHLLSEAEEDAIRRPFQEIMSDVKTTADQLGVETDRLGLDKYATSKPDPAPAVEPAPAASSPVDLGKPAAADPPAPIAGRYDDIT